MTKTLKEVLEIAWRLPDQEQDALAAPTLDELAVDERWESASERGGFPHTFESVVKLIIVGYWAFCGSEAPLRR